MTHGMESQVRSGNPARSEKLRRGTDKLGQPRFLSAAAWVSMANKCFGSGGSALESSGTGTPMSNAHLRGVRSLPLRPLCLLAGITALLGSGVSSPQSLNRTTHELVPSPTSVAEIQRLAQQTGAIAIVITTDADEKTLVIKADRPSLLSGNIVNDHASIHPSLSQESIALPFDSVALVYYTEPENDQVDLRQRIPHKQSFPELPMPGSTERALACPALDTELARAEALHWVARYNRATPFTRDEMHFLHVKKAVDAGTTAVLSLERVTVVPRPVPREIYRWAISGIDERIEGLLRLKVERQCDGRATLSPNLTDLALLRDLDAWRLQQADSQEQALLAQRTEAFDQLGPKPVTTQEQTYLQPGEVIEQQWDDVMWYPRYTLYADHAPGDLSKAELQQYRSWPNPDWKTFRAGFGWPVELMLTDKAVVLITEQPGRSNLSVDEATVRIAYEDIDTLTTKKRLGMTLAVYVKKRAGVTDTLALSEMKPAPGKIITSAMQGVADAMQKKLAEYAQSHHPGQP